jgi:peptide deformylase
MNYGRGIASPQVNEHYRLVALNLGGDPAKYQALNDNSQGFQGGTSKTSFSLFNPVITEHSNETFTMWDDCMSFPHLMVRVRRNTKVSIRFWTVVQQDDMQEGRVVLASDNEGNAVVEIEWCNVPQDISELLQHEIDHLDGVLSMDRIATDPSTDIIDRNEYLENSFKFDQMVEYTIAPTI